MQIRNVDIGTDKYPIEIVEKSFVHKHLDDFPKTYKRKTQYFRFGVMRRSGKQ